MLNRPPLRVAVLCSRRAPGLEYVVAHAGERDWRIVCCVTSGDACTDEDVVRRHSLPMIYHPVRAFYAQHQPGAALKDLAVREAYDRRTVEMLADYRPDVVLLAGYLLLLTRPVLDAFGGRILNVHHSDLRQRDAAGGPRYPGLRAVRDAVLAGEAETRCTVHLVTARLDDGPPLLQSPAYQVPEITTWALAHGEKDVLCSMIRAHQEWMLRTAFGPLMVRALDLVAAGARNTASTTITADGARDRARPLERAS